MQQHRKNGIRNASSIVRSVLLFGGCCLSACSTTVYPASQCKPPPPPLTVPNSPRSQCREVATEHAKDWPQQYKDIQYIEENAVYRVRLAFSELSDNMQKQLQSDFTEAAIDINNADGKYLQEVDASVAAGDGEREDAAKRLAKALEKFVAFLPERLQGTPPGTMTSSAQKDIDRAKVALEQLNAKANPAPPPEE